MLSGPEDMNIVEGGPGAMVTVTTNRAVDANTEVMVVRDRAASSAGDDDYMRDPPLIHHGRRDDRLDQGEGRRRRHDGEHEQHAGRAGARRDSRRQGGNQVKGEVKLYTWDAAVPTLPIIAQLLLAAFLAIGGYRRYLRR